MMRHHAGGPRVCRASRVCGRRANGASSTTSAELEIMRGMNGSVAWRAALVAGPGGGGEAAWSSGSRCRTPFFESWGLAGRPGARGRRARCSPARCCASPLLAVLAGAAARRHPELDAGADRRLTGSGAPFRGRLLFAYWCARLAARQPPRPAWRWREMDLGLAGRVALVTGGSGGSGAGCQALAAEGVAVAVTARIGERAEEAAAEIGAGGTGSTPRTSRPSPGC